MKSLFHKLLPVLSCLAFAVAILLHGCVTSPKEANSFSTSASYQPAATLAAQWTDEQCNMCHEVKFKSFAEEHHDFGKNYPYFRRNSIRFNHQNHLKKHFRAKLYEERAPENCTTCHNVEKPQHVAVEGGFERNCAQCHTEIIRRQELVLLRRPKAADEFQPTPLLSLLLNLNETSKPTKEVTQFITKMASKGKGKLAVAIRGESGSADSEKLLKGLNDAILSAWSKGGTHPQPAKDQAGWYVEEDELRYRPAGHTDSVAKAWMEFSASIDVQGESKDKADERLTGLRHRLLFGDTSVGRCSWCHAISQKPETPGRLTMEWQRPHLEAPSYSRFAHAPHLEKDRQEEGCSACHKMTRRTRYDRAFDQFDAATFTSNFRRLSKDNCLECHDGKKAQQSCSTCHVNHRLREIKDLVVRGVGKRLESGSKEKN